MRQIFERFLKDLSSTNPMYSYLMEGYHTCFVNPLLEASIGTHIKWSDFTNPMVRGGVALMKSINDFGYEAYVVGGAVRDIAMGDKDIHDVDIATNMPIEELKTKFKIKEYGGGEKHGTVIVHFQDNDYELTQFRTEKGYTDNRRPDEVKFVKSFEEDTKRRDFTINSMGIDASGKIIDYHGGIKDIEKGEVRTVGEPKERFEEDALRILRAVRFAAKYDFKVDEKTHKAISELAHTVSSTSIERIRDELIKTISYGGTKFANALKLMNETGLWNAIIPEIKLSDEKISHVAKANSNESTVNFAILMTGMPVEEVAEIGKRLTFTTKEIKTISYIIGNINNYVKLDSIDRQQALAIVQNPDFSLLRTVFTSIAGKDIDNADEKVKYISALGEITERQKAVNQMIQNAGFTGANFGMAVKSVGKWMFGEYDSGHKPTDSEIEEFIKKLK